MREKIIESALVRQVRNAGGLCLKFVSPGWDGAPDRIILLPEGRIFFVEVKAPGEVPRPLQVRRHKQLKEMGFPVFVIDELGKIPSLISSLEGNAVLLKGGGDVSN